MGEYILTLLLILSVLISKLIQMIFYLLVRLDIFSFPALLYVIDRVLVIDNMIVMKIT